MFSIPNASGIPIYVDPYVHAAWGSVQTKSVDPDSEWNFAMGGGFAAASEWGTPTVVYFSATSPEEIDLPPLPDSCAPPGGGPYIGMDAQGRVVAAWGGQCSAGAQGSSWHDHAYYARYTPISGWTAPTRIDGDEGPGISGQILGLGVNDSGQAWPSG